MHALSHQFQSVGAGIGPGPGSLWQGYRWLRRGAVCKPSVPMSNCVLNWTCGDMLCSNRPLLAAGQLARR